MIFCAKCRTEMKCVRTGARVAWQGSTHVYPGDRFECKTCGADVVACVKDSTLPYHSDPPIVDDGDHNFRAKG